MPRSAARKDHPLAIRLSEADLAVIDRAAQLRGRSRTDFVREAAVRAAEDAILDPRFTRGGAVAQRRKADAPKGRKEGG